MDWAPRGRGSETLIDDSPAQLFGNLEALFGWQPPWPVAQVTDTSLDTAVVAGSSPARDVNPGSSKVEHRNVP